MVDIIEISAVVAAAGVLVGVIYYILDIRNQAMMRKTELVTKLYSTFQSKEFAEATLKVWNLEFKDFDDFVKRYGPWYSETEVYKAFRMVCLFFNGIGILLMWKFVDIEMVVKLFHVSAKTTWEKVKPLVEGGRKQTNTLLFDEFEYLYNEVKKREQLASKTA